MDLEIFLFPGGWEMGTPSLQSMVPIQGNAFSFILNTNEDTCQQKYLPLKVHSEHPCQEGPGLQREGAGNDGAG